MQGGKKRVLGIGASEAGGEKGGVVATKRKLLHAGNGENTGGGCNEKENQSLKGEQKPE